MASAREGAGTLDGPKGRPSLSLLFLIIPPTLIIFACYFLGKGKILWWEILIHFLVIAMLMTGGWFLSRWGSVQDREIWNGRVASKPSGTQGCCHDYECMCSETCTGSGSERSCSETCSTCYEHSRDKFWKAVSTNGEVVYKNLCNPPGTPTPRRWQNIQTGEPTAVEHRYTNYIKAASGTFFQREGLRGTFKNTLPPYPRVKGWKVDRFLFVGMERPDGHAAWNERLMAINGDLGREKQVNIIVVVTTQPPDYHDALASHWLGGKKNDFILVVGAKKYPRIDWVRVMTWMDPVGEGEAGGIHDIVPRKVQALGDFDGAKVLTILRDDVRAGFVRKPMSDFRYLMKGVEPPLWALLLLSLGGLLLSSLLAWLFWRNSHEERVS